MANNDSLNTGPGGFEIDGKTYDYDLGLSEAAGGPQGTRGKVIDVSAGYQDGSGKPKDLTAKTKKTLGQYLSAQTTGKGTATSIPNDYPVDPDTKEISIRTPTGQPGLQTPGPSSAENSKAFAPEESSLTSFTQNYSTISSLIKKGKSDSVAVGGNDLLPGIPGTAQTPGLLSNPIKGHSDTSKILGSYVSSVLSTNRFTDASNSFIASSDLDTIDIASAGALGFDPNMTKQGSFGVFDPNAPKVKIGQLASIGPLLTMRAGKELNSSNPGVSPNDGGIQAAALLPGVGQLGIERITPQAMYASDILASLTNSEPSGDTFVSSPGGLSWGQLNNTDDPYSGTDALGMLVLSTALVAGVEVVFDALSIILGLITPQLKKPARDAQGRYNLGEYYPGTKDANKSTSGGIGGALSALTSLNFGALLGIQPTNFAFSHALTTGMNAFFQIPDSDGGIGVNLGGALSSSTDSPGFNVVVARAIIRSSLTIIDQIKKIGGNVMSAITQILSLIDTIRSSKLISACNAFASLGDAILTLPKAWIDNQAAGGTKVSQMDQVDNALTNAVIKNRLRGSLKLAWAQNRAPTMMLLPGSIIGPSYTASGMGQFDDKLGVQQDPLSKLSTTVMSDSTKNRIDPGDAAIFEAQFDAEYVPFYFHDIRTNEIIGFHAFLASLTDDYAAAYEKSEGFGRVESVKIYKSTERRISLSFYIAATSPKDFDEMWVKINKLVTLVYPQYTAGVQMADSTGAQYQFTQPFSQLIGASPLVRIRLGDLFRSNYSRFALARLFGLGNSTFTINSKTDSSSFDGDVLKKYQDNLSLALTAPQNETYYVAPGSYNFIDPSSGGIGGSVGLGGSSSGPANAPVFYPHQGSVPGLFIVEAQKPYDPNAPAGGSISLGGGGGGSSPPAGDTLLVCKVKLNDDPTYQKTFSPALVAATAEYGTKNKPLQNFIGGTYIIPASALTPTKKTKARLLSAAGTASGGSFATELATFMDPKSNAIAKSFQDTGGKGLAGFIETLNFDWYEKTTWETELDRTAPKFCKVTLGFSPIHDITPGLDHMGFNRAPVYPVASMAQGDDTSAPGAGGTLWRFQDIRAARFSIMVHNLVQVAHVKRSNRPSNQVNLCVNN